MLLATKAETIRLLRGKLRNGRTLPAISFSVLKWREATATVLSQIIGDDTLSDSIIVRSSAADEDSASASNAGRFLSLPATRTWDRVQDAVEKVIASYGRISDEDQVLVQPFLKDTVASGVAFNRDPKTGTRYDVVNYAVGSDTSVVTSGGGGKIETYTSNRGWAGPRPEPANKVVSLLRELEELFGDVPLDIEFACSRNGDLYLLQVRRLVCASVPSVDERRHGQLLQEVHGALTGLLGPSRSMVGERSLLGVMPDWNPAEMIGTRPRSLAMSLYRFLITDDTWAQQRRKYGYRDVSDTPLMIDIHGLPYIDVRASFNSFVPATLPDDVAARYVDSCISRLSANPHLHDKVEFDVIPNCYTFDIAERLDLLDGIRFPDKSLVVNALRNLSKSFLSGEHLGTIQKDEGEIRRLERLQSRETSGTTSTVFDIHRMLVECRRHGTLPFAGLARAAFVAMDLLRSAVRYDLIPPEYSERILMGLRTPTSRLLADAAQLDREAFLGRYGHLRPGTYDIRVPSYDEAPDRYLDAMQGRTTAVPSHDASSALDLPNDVAEDLERALHEHGLDCSSKSFLKFLDLSVVGREDAKFVFTRSVSRVLGMIVDLGKTYGFSRDDLSYMDIRDILDLRATSNGVRDALHRSMEAGKAKYADTNALTLPPLIRNPEDAFCFHVPVSQPNFITRRIAEGPVRESDAPDLTGSIVFIANADPGFDWIFNKGIAGLVTAYGGKNSHMAIRAAELALPAIVGAGEPLFEKWRDAGVLRIDCGSERVEMIG